jgi:amino acid adenylation domain-containing protein
MQRSLVDLVTRAAAENPDGLAVRGPDTTLTYRELDRAASQIAHALSMRGVKKGDRVGIWVEKSARAVAAMQGVLRLGAAYVPIDPFLPIARARVILRDCAMSALVTTSSRADDLCAEEAESRLTYLVTEDGVTSGAGARLSWAELEPLSSAVDDPRIEAHDLAYILYTSGSTGTPKGVCISHENALAFVDWAARALEARPGDRFANHAPFHFDLSVLDLYAAFSAGACVSIIPDGMSYLASNLVDFIAREKISVWYSVPSALIMMMEDGGLLETPALSLRAVLFAGEPFPIKHLRRLRRRWPALRLMNLYGPTETNVCTYHEVGDIDDARTAPVPIGRACSGDRVWAVRQDGGVAGPGEQGELYVAGPTVMLGYWGKPPLGDAPYATGDIVRLQDDGDYAYIGRRDDMVKVRGHRVELGDVEAALETHPAVHEAAVIVAGEGLDARLVAFLVARGEARASLLEMKRHCASRLPRYMIVDAVRHVRELPRTRNGKIDRQRLAAHASEMA